MVGLTSENSRLLISSKVFRSICVFECIVIILVNLLYVYFSDMIVTCHHQRRIQNPVEHLTPPWCLIWFWIRLWSYSLNNFLTKNNFSIVFVLANVSLGGITSDKIAFNYDFILTVRASDKIGIKKINKKTAEKEK